jgi:Ca2+-binding EF-hand superfamily protein
MPSLVAHKTAADWKYPVASIDHRGGATMPVVRFRTDHQEGKVMMRSRMFNRTLFALSMSVGAAFSATTLAADDKVVAADFAAMDTNHDGKLSADEYTATAKDKFAKMDIDHNGQVTAAEMDAYRKTPKGRDTNSMSSVTRIKAMDTNNDGQLSLDEVTANAKDKFKLMDTDNDGQLSAAELQVGHDTMKGAAGY